MKRLLLALVFSAGGIASSYAACPATSAQMKDNAAAVFQMGQVSDSNGNCTSKVDIDTGSQLHTDLAAINTTAGAAIPSQSPAVPVGGMGICDGANGTTNPCTTAATVKVASTPAAATDKALVVDQRPGTTITTTTGSADPCQSNVATIKPFSITTATTTNIVTGTSAKKLYVCYLYMQSAAANNVAVISGTTGATCGANTAALVGGTTAANGLNNAANGGQAFGNGASAVLQVQTNNDDICIITSAATPLAGAIKYVVQ